MRMSSSERARPAPRRPGEHLGHGGHGQPRLLEGALDRALCLLFVLLEHKPVGGEPQGLPSATISRSCRQERVERKPARRGTRGLRRSCWGCREAAGSSDGIPAAWRAAGRGRIGTRRGREPGMRLGDTARRAGRAPLRFRAQQACTRTSSGTSRRGLPAPAGRCAPRVRRSEASAAPRRPRPCGNGCPDIEHHAAADGRDGREHPDDEAVAGEQQRRFAEHDTGISAAPGPSLARPSSSRTSAWISAVPAWKCTGARCFSGLAEGRRSASSRVRGRLEKPGSESTSRERGRRVRYPARLTAVRCPAEARAADSPWTSRPRTRSRRPSG